MCSVGGTMVGRFRYLGFVPGETVSAHSREMAVTASRVFSLLVVRTETSSLA